MNLREKKLKREVIVALYRLDPKKYSLNRLSKIFKMTRAGTSYLWKKYSNSRTPALSTEPEFDTSPK